MKKPLIIASVVAVAVIALVAVLISVFFSSSDKMVCKSDEANITLLYNNNLVGYTASGLSYDLDSQKEYAEEVGIDAYLTEFETWFEINTGGTCTRKE